MSLIKKLLLFWLILFFFISDALCCFSGNRFIPTDSIKIKNQIIPAVLIISGVSINSHHIKERLQSVFPRTDTNIDDFFQWTPVGIMYTADIFTRDHRNSVFNQTKYLILSEIATSVITQFLKKATWIARPNGGTRSFPSGHTSNAFTSATVLFHEYRDFDLGIATSGYLFSTATGILRVTNNRHWVPDVLAGAGIGILMTNLIYWWEPLKNWDPFKKGNMDKVTILPQINPDEGDYLVTISINF